MLQAEPFARGCRRLATVTVHRNDRRSIRRVLWTHLFVLPRELLLSTYTQLLNPTLQVVGSRIYSSSGLCVKLHRGNITGSAEQTLATLSFAIAIFQPRLRVVDAIESLDRVLQPTFCYS